LINKPVQVEVQFGVSNGCGQFGKFLESSNGNTRTIEVEAKYIGCICTQDIPIRNTQYEFLTSEPGVYRLMFKSGKSNFIEIDIEITE